MPPTNSKINQIASAFVTTLEGITVANGYHTDVAKVFEGAWAHDEPNNLPGCEVYIEEVNYEHAMGSEQTTGRARVAVSGCRLLEFDENIGIQLRNFGRDIIVAVMRNRRLGLSFVIDTTYTAMAHDQALEDRDRRGERFVEVHFDVRYTHDVEEP